MRPSPETNPSSAICPISSLSLSLLPSLSFSVSLFFVSLSLSLSLLFPPLPGLRAGRVALSGSLICDGLPAVFAHSFSFCVDGCIPIRPSRGRIASWRGCVRSSAKPTPIICGREISVSMHFRQLESLPSAWLAPHASTFDVMCVCLSLHFCVYVSPFCSLFVSTHVSVSQ